LPPKFISDTYLVSKFKIDEKVDFDSSPLEVCYEALRSAHDVKICKEVLFLYFEMKFIER
jgi:hypothetical protein